MSFIAGSYTATLDPDQGGAGAAATVGQIEQGITFSQQVFKEEIRGDNFAQTVQDSIFQGIGVTFSMVLLEYNEASVRAAFWPYGTAWLTMSAVIGTLDTANAGSWVFTAKAGTPAAATPASITILQAILAQGFPVDLLFSPSLRKVPLRHTVYPNSSGVFGTLA